MGHISEKIEKLKKKENRHEPFSFHQSKGSQEVACVVCARKDWLESRFTVYLWREATGSSTYSELRHDESGNSELLTCGEHLCFGSRDLIDKLLTTKRYSELFPLIPPEQLHGSSALHPADERMSWLLHTRRVQMVPNSRKAPQSSAEQPSSQYKCAGVGDIDAVAHIWYVRRGQLH